MVPWELKAWSDYSLINIYPNPVANILFVDGVFMTDKNAIQINDVLGNVVCEWNNIEHMTPSIDVSKLSKGIYFITIENENGLSVMRVMKTD